MIQDSLFNNATESPRSLEERKKYVQSYLESALTAKEWCRRNGVNLHSLKNWLYKQRPKWEQTNSVGRDTITERASRWTRLQIQSSEETKATAVPVVPIVPVILGVPAVPAEIQIEIGNIRLRVTSATPPDLLRMVLREVTTR